MVATGYLKTDVSEDGTIYVSIPNKEMYRVYGNMIVSHFLRGSDDNVRLFANAILRNDTVGAEEKSRYLLKSSGDSMMPDSEHVYQVISLGMLVHLAGKYGVMGEFEAGSGRYDIRMKKNRKLSQRRNRNQTCQQPLRRQNPRTPTGRNRSDHIKRLRARNGIRRQESPHQFRADRIGLIFSSLRSRKMRTNMR